MSRQPQVRTRVTGAVMAHSGEAAAWQAVPPMPVDEPHLLAGVAVASPGEVWVAGHAHQQPLIARWDGSSWTIPSGPPPVPNHIGAGFQGIAAKGSQAIAVGGGYDRLAGTEVPLIQHWDGSAWERWDAWPDPEAARGYVLTDIATVGGGRAWAVGHGVLRGGPSGPVAMHWSEGAWQFAELPSVPKGKLLAVSGTAPDDVWAVGAADRSGLIMRFDGRTWKRVPSPSTRFPLTGVVATSPSSAWAVGRDRVLHWNGRRWAKTKAPVTAANTVTALSPDNVWIAGGRGELTHFDGNRWTPTGSPHKETGSQARQAVAEDETAVWLASAAHPESAGVWLAGSYQVTRTGTIGSTPTITAQSGDAS